MKRTKKSETKTFNVILKIIIMIVLFIISFYVLRCTAKFFLGDYFPYKQTKFTSYNSFKEKAEAALFPDELPSSVKDVQYFYQTGHYDSKTGVSFVLEDKTEYQKMKADCESYYVKYASDSENFKYLFDIPFTHAFVNEEKLEFIFELTNNASDYHMIAYENMEASPKDRKAVILCNDATQEIIIFDYWDAHN